MKKIIGFYIFFFVIFLIGCDGYQDNYLNTGDYYSYDNESYLEINENPFINTLDKAESIFSLDTSTAGYANLRRLINQGVNIHKDHVKLEQMVNYFRYNYPSPENDDALSISSEIMTCPWNQENKIASIGLKAKDVDKTTVRNNIVFLVDVSGSMDNPLKLPLLQSAIILFVETLNDNDIVSVVTYASGVRVALDGAYGFEKKRIVNIVEDLVASGSTSGERGIQKAYEIAEKYFIEGGNNRVILGTDGDFNVGISSTNELKDFISKKRQTNIYLSCLGFGYGNIKDDKLETLAMHGNGNYAYIDSITEARKVLVEEIGGTLNIVSKDTKAQVVFNPKYVKSYRLLGYENRMLTDDQFNDDKTDAGEIGAGHMVTAVYELVLNDDENITTTMNDSWYKVHIRHKDPINSENKELISFFNQTSEKINPSEDLLFISGVLEFGLILRNSEFKANANMNQIIARLENLNCVANDDYKKEFLDLVKKYQQNNNNQ